MSDERKVEQIEQAVMTSTSVRPTMVVPPTTGSAPAPALTPGVSTASDIATEVVGMREKAARRLLEPLGFLVRTLAEGEALPEGEQRTDERANLVVVDGRVTAVTLG